MKRFYNHTYLLFLGLAAIMFVLSTFYRPIDVVDINIHDTYYVTAVRQWLRLLACIFGVEGFIYWVFPKIKRVPNKRLILLHVVLTHGVLLFVLFYHWLAPANDGFPLYDDANHTQNLHLVIGILLLLGRLIFMVNTIKTLLQK